MAVDGIACRFFPWIALQSIVSGGGLSPAALLALGFRLARQEGVGDVVEGKRLPVRSRFDRTESEFRFPVPRRDEKAAGKEDCRLSPVDAGQGEGGFPVSGGEFPQRGKHPRREAGKVALGGFAGVEVGGGGVPRVARLGKAGVGGAGEARRVVSLQRKDAGGLLGGFVGGGGGGGVFRGLHGDVSRDDRGFPRRVIARGLDCSPRCRAIIARGALCWRGRLDDDERAVRSVAHPPYDGELWQD